MSMATAPTTCPSIEQIEKLALGAADAAPLRDHVAGCADCQAALERVRADNAFLAGFAEGDALPASARETARAEIDIPGYQILHEIHRGGQGVVYKAVQRGTHRDVAVKVMKRGPFATLADRARFDREVEILGRLNHRNIIAVHHAGASGGFQYFIMNYVDGRTLDEAVRPAAARSLELLTPVSGTPGADATRGAAPACAGGSDKIASGLGDAELMRMLGIFAKVCNAVHAAHLRGVMHRDLKPSNVLVDANDEPFVLDFGLAKSSDSHDDSAMTRSGQFVGSLPWASPEQIEGSGTRVDLRTDVYSLGAILFQLLTGRLPFDVDSSLRTAVDHIVQREPPRPSALLSKTGGTRIDDELDTIVLKCLSKDRDRRYQSAGELERDIRRYIADEPIEAKRDSAIYILRKTLRRYRFRVSVAAAFAILLGVLTVVMAFLYRRSTRAEQQAVQATHSLSNLLSQSNIDRGRMAAMLGNLDQGERLIWGETLSSPDPHDSALRRMNTPPGPVDAYWALWEMYRRNPCTLTLREQPSVPRSITLATDGSGIWTADMNGRVALFSPDGRVLDEYKFEYSGGLGMPFADPTGTLVIKRSTKDWMAWRRGNPKALISEPRGDALLSAACVSKNGKLFGILLGGAARIWQAQPLTQIAEFHSEQLQLTGLTFSNDETLVATRDESGGLQVHSLATGAIVARIENPASGVGVLRSGGELLFSDDDHLLADAWGDTSGRIWNWTDNPSRVMQLSDRPGDARYLSFTPDGKRLAIADLGGAVWTFDTASGRRIGRFVAHAAPVRSVAYSRHCQTLWTVGATGDIRAWEVEPDAGVRVVPFEGQALHCVAVDPLERLIVAGGLRSHVFVISDSTVRTINLGDSSTVTCLAFSPDGRWVAASTLANSVYVWNPVDDPPAPRVLAHSNRVSQIAFSPDGQYLASACDDNAARLWRLSDFTSIAELHGARDRFPSIAFDPDGSHLAGAVRDGNIFIWSIADGQAVRLESGVNVPVRGVRFLPDGRRLVSAGAGRTVDLWNLDKRERIACWPGHNQEIFCLDVSPDGTLIASGDSGGQIRLWHTGIERFVAALDGHSGAIMSLAFAADGRSLTSASLDGTVRVWDFDHYKRHIAGQVTAQLQLHASAVDSADSRPWVEWAGLKAQSSIMKSEPLPR